jgi:hypothetical protein
VKGRLAAWSSPEKGQQQQQQQLVCSAQIAAAIPLLPTIRATPRFFDILNHFQRIS